MRTHPFYRILLAIPALALISGAANALAPTLEFQDGGAASVPVTSGSISFEGVTVNGLPVVGSIGAPELQVNGSVTLGAFNPLNVDFERVQSRRQQRRGLVLGVNFRHNRAGDFTQLERLLRSFERPVRRSDTFGFAKLFRSVEFYCVGILRAAGDRFRADRRPFFTD